MQDRTELHPSAILVVMPAWVGDVVMAEPLLRRIQQQFPEAAIDALAAPWVGPLCSRLPAVRQVIDCAFAHGEFRLLDRYRFGKQLRQRYQRAYILPNSWKSALIPYFAHIPIRIGYTGESRYGLINQHYKLNKQQWPLMVQRFLYLATPLNSINPLNPQISSVSGSSNSADSVDSSSFPKSPNSWNSADSSYSRNSAESADSSDFPKSPNSQDSRNSPDSANSANADWADLGDASYLAPVINADESATRLLCQRFALDALPRPWVCLCPGAEYGPAKRWPVSHFAELAARLIEQGFTVIVLGSAKDQDDADSIYQSLSVTQQQQCKNLCGETRLTEAIDVISAADLVVCNDSGLMHIAAALGRPLIAIFGSSSPGFTPPLPRPGASKPMILQHELPCRPCFQRRCRFEHYHCLTEISPATVLEAILNHLRQPTV